MVAPTLSTAMMADMGYLNLLAAQEAEATLMRASRRCATWADRPSVSSARSTKASWPGRVSSLWRLHLADGRARRLSPALGNSENAKRSSQLHGADWRGSHRRLSGRGPAAHPGKPHAGRQPDRAHGGRRGVVAFRSADTTQYTEAELRAAVEAAEDWGTYVTAHAYTPRSIKRAIDAGVLCIEHGHLLDEATAKLMADKGIWLSLQPFLDDEDANPVHSPTSRARQLEVTAGTDRAYALAKKYKIKTAFGTDIPVRRPPGGRQGAQLAKLIKWYTPGETLKMATGDNGQLLAISGLRSPYPGKLGVVEEGALADLLLVDGNPLRTSNWCGPAKNFVVIMKDGKIFKTW